MAIRATALRALSLLALQVGCAPAPDERLLWPEGAPGSAGRSREPEQRGPWWVANVHRPSLTIFRAEPRRSRRAAVVVIPGGGHSQLVFGPEGVEPARLLARHGLTALALKYRLAHEPGSPYRVEEHARADVLRAVRWVRQHAAELGVDPTRVGVLGFSAGGELAQLASYGASAGDPRAADPVDRLDARPSFHVAVYPGPLGLPDRLSADAPPAFLLCANDDPLADVVVRLASLYRTAERPVELHLYARGGHGFNLGRRSELGAIRHWPARLLEWLAQAGLIAE
jgi:acetyl esterase/lipase